MDCDEFLPAVPADDELREPPRHAAREQNVLRSQGQHKLESPVQERSAASRLDAHSVEGHEQHAEQLLAERHAEQLLSGPHGDVLLPAESAPLVAVPQTQAKRARRPQLREPHCVSQLLLLQGYG